MMGVREIVIWAHSECGSNMALFREVRRQAGVPVTIALWKHGEADDVRRRREAQGQPTGEYADLGAIPVGEDLAKGRALLAAHGGAGSVQVFCVYQNSRTWRRLIAEAKRGGARVVVNAEAPCPMCVGPKALLKRLYYRLALPWKVHGVTVAADLFLNASGRSGVAALRRLGWEEGKIVPFGYASDLPAWLPPPSAPHPVGAPLRVLHAGSEAPYRDVRTLLRAAAILRQRGIPVDVVRTGGAAALPDLARHFAWADVFVACGLCEPWGMRVNDAIHAGLPAIVSGGMGAAWLVGEFGCGAVFEPRNATALADILERFAKEADFAARLHAGVAAAHEAWTPAARAKVWLEAVVGK